MSPALILTSVAIYTLAVFAIGMWGFKKARPTLEDSSWGENPGAFFRAGRNLVNLVFRLLLHWPAGAYYRHGISFFGIAGNILLTPCVCI